MDGISPTILKAYIQLFCILVLPYLAWRLRRMLFTLLISLLWSMTRFSFGIVVGLLRFFARVLFAGLRRAWADLLPPARVVKEESKSQECEKEGGVRRGRAVYVIRS